MQPNAIKWIWLSIFIVFLDQLSKYYISHQLDLYESFRLLYGVNITYIHNAGAAFSFLSDAGGWQRWLFIVLSTGISIALVFWLKEQPSERVWLSIALALVLGGAVGNLIDRILLGYVVDFIDIYYKSWHWPVFNIADSAITVGVIMLIIDSFWLDRSKVATNSRDAKR